MRKTCESPVAVEEAGNDAVKRTGKSTQVRLKVVF